MLNSGFLSIIIVFDAFDGSIYYTLFLYTLHIAIEWQHTSILHRTVPPGGGGEEGGFCIIVLPPQ